MKKSNTLKFSIPQKSKILNKVFIFCFLKSKITAITGQRAKLEQFLYGFFNTII